MDDDNEPLPDEAVTAPQPTMMYSYDKPMFCPCRVDQMPNNEGSWVNHQWDEIAAKLEFELPDDDAKVVHLRHCPPRHKHIFDQASDNLGVLSMAWMPFLYGLFSGDTGS